MPATAKLLATIASLPRGAVVLPGLDTDLDDDAWSLIGGGASEPPASGHPQFALHALLQRIGIVRADVTVLGESSARGRLVSEAMRPSMRTERWAQRIDEAARGTALANIAVIEAANAEDEALAIAVALREAVHDDKTAALVTPDRALARRVAAALGRWTIEADDSGGDALPDTEAGVFARLVAEAALGELPPVKLLAMLKHARFRLGAAAGAHAKAIATLELAILRGPRPRPGTAGLAHALATFRATDLHRSDPRGKLKDADLDAARALIAALGRALAPLEEVKRAQSFTAIAALHAAALRALSRDDDGVEAAFAGDDGEALDTAFAEIAEQGGGLRVSAGDYPDLFEIAIADRTCHRAGRPGARVQILGPARSAACQRRPRGARRAGRGRVAAGNAQRSVALAPDAARPRARSPRTARRPFGARLRPIARHARGHSDPRREARRRADGCVALHATARGGRGRDAMGRRAPPGREISRLGAQPRPRRQGESHRAPAPAAAARRPADAAQRHRDRALAARSLHDLRQAHPEASSARRRRYAARRARPRHRDPRRDRRVHRNLCQGPAARSARRAARARRDAFRAAAGFSRGARILVAALRAHRAMVRRLGGAAPPQCHRDARRGAAPRSTSRSTSASSG